MTIVTLNTAGPAAPRPVVAAPAASVSTPSAGDGFDGALGAAAEMAPAAPPIGAGSRNGELEPLQKFESFVLRTFIDSMLPKENASFFGEGTAGDIWRSMLAERIGDELAASGGIGIADMLAENKAVAGRVSAAESAMDQDNARAVGASNGIVR